MPINARIEMRIYQFNLENKFFRSFATYQLAAESLNLSIRTARNILSAADSTNSRKSAYGYRWSYSYKLPEGCRELTEEEIRNKSDRSVKLFLKNHKRTPKQKRSHKVALERLSTKKKRAEMIKRLSK